ncbi:MAG: hypothetical protein BWX84_00712 [Verrucomicrobia bacterium ADurb.Bin118]|nr:MAG: hypothetical protein BWX84_00712 [Verrucomicrobia bacterium ADurb.Bin118]
MGRQLLRAHPGDQTFPCGFKQRLATPLAGAREFSLARQHRTGFSVQRAQEGIFEPVPQLVAGGLPIHKGQKGEPIQIFHGLHRAGKMADHGRVV